MAALSSLPPMDTKYYNTWMTTMGDTDGSKLVVGTKTLNALIASSLRIDSVHQASIRRVISYFDLNNSTALMTLVFLDNESIEKANLLAGDPNATKINRFDLHYQLRQLRSKFEYPSTYLLCRASSMFVNDLRSQPYTIFTLYELSNTGRDSAAKIASKLFNYIANLMLSSTDPTLSKQYVKTLLVKCQYGQIKSILQKIIELYHKDRSIINILDSHALNMLLALLASLVLANKSVAENVKSRVLNGH